MQLPRFTYLFKVFNCAGPTFGLGAQLSLKGQKMVKWSACSPFIPNNPVRILHVKPSLFRHKKGFNRTEVNPVWANVTKLNKLI